jgi:hypothetical protein
MAARRAAAVADAVENAVVEVDVEDGDVAVVQTSPA